MTMKHAAILAVVWTMAALPVSAQVVPTTIDFHDFNLGPVNGQNGWGANGAQIVLLSDEGDDYAGYDYKVARVTGSGQSMGLSSLATFPIQWDSNNKFYSQVVSFDVMFSATYTSLLDAGYSTSAVGNGQITMLQYCLGRIPSAPGSQDSYVVPFYQGLEARVNSQSRPIQNSPTFYEPLLAKVWYHMELVFEWATGEDGEELLMNWVTIQPEGGELWASEPAAIQVGDPTLWTGDVQTSALLRFNFMGATLAGETFPYYIRGLSVAPLPVPEPATMSVLALGGLALLRRRRK